MAKWTLTKKDKEVIEAFANKKELDSKKLHSDGKVLSKGIRKHSPVAEWRTTKRKGRKQTKLIGLTLERSVADKKIMGHLRKIVKVGELGSKTKLPKGTACATIKLDTIKRLMRAAGVKGSTSAKYRRFTATRAGKIYYDRKAKCWMWEVTQSTSLEPVGPAPVLNAEGVRGIAYLFASVQSCG